MEAEPLRNNDDRREGLNGGLEAEDERDRFNKSHVPKELIKY